MACVKDAPNTEHIQAAKVWMSQRSILNQKDAAAGLAQILPNLMDLSGE
jgi:hypothetical protein